MSSSSSLAAQVRAGLTSWTPFDADACSAIENKIESVCRDADAGKFRVCTVDRAPLRNK
jgi:hypothetical protein